MKYTKNQIETMSSYKMNYKGEKVLRPCLGPGCRGKKFLSFGGARICQNCKALIEGLGID